MLTYKFSNENDRDNWVQVCRNIPVNLSPIEPRADMWKAGLSVVAKLNMARYSNRQRERIQNPSSVDSNSTRATTARCDEPPHFASTLTATKFNTCKGPVCCGFESHCPVPI